MLSDVIDTMKDIKQSELTDRELQIIKYIYTRGYESGKEYNKNNIKEVIKLDNPFNNMSDNEFVYRISAFLGKENFTRLINIVNNEQICSSIDKCDSKCGEYYYKFIGEYKKRK